MMAIKDEYEVARLYTDGAFAAALSAQFDGDYTIYHLAPPYSRVLIRSPTSGGPLWAVGKTGDARSGGLKGLRGTA